MLDVETPALGTLAVEGELVATDTFDVAITATDVEVRGGVPVTGRLDSGSGRQPLATRIAANTARAVNNAGTNLADVISDPTGGTMWQDTANDLVWIKYVGGLALNVYNYNGTNDASLMRRYQIRLSRP